MFHTVLTNFIIGNASCFFFTSHTFLSEKQQSFESIRAKPSSPKQNDENDARKREDFETTRLTFFPSSTFETLCMLYFSQFLQSCSYKPSNIANQDLARATKKENGFLAIRLTVTGLQATALLTIMPTNFTIQPLWLMRTSQVMKKSLCYDTKSHLTNFQLSNPNYHSFPKMFELAWLSPSGKSPHAENACWVITKRIWSAKTMKSLNSKSVLTSKSLSCRVHHSMTDSDALNQMHGRICRA